MGEGRSGQVTMVRDLFSPNNPLFLTCSPPRLDLIHLSQAEISLQLQCAGVTQAAEALDYIPERNAKIWHLGYWDTYPLGYSWDFPFCQVFYIFVERKKAVAAACLRRQDKPALTSLSSRKALLQAEAASGSFWAMRVGAAKSAFPHSASHQGSH